MDLFLGDIRKLNPSVPVLQLSAVSGEGTGAWMEWLKGKRSSVSGER